MASMQCQNACETSCQQTQKCQQQHSSLGQKVSDIFKGKGHQHGCHVQAQTNGSATKCQGKTKKVHKRTLFDKIKDGLSGHSSDSSSSESDSDDEKCHKSKN